MFVDIKLDDVTELRTYLHKGTMSELAKNVNALVAINGDYWNYDVD